MKLYAHPMSTCSRKVLTVLAEKNVEAEMVVIDLMKGAQKHESFLETQPFGVVPAIDDDGFKLYESRAIMRYLDETLPGIALTPKDAKGKARMEQFISIEHSYFSSHAMKIVGQKLMNPMRGQATDESIVEAARKALTTSLDVAEKEVAAHGFMGTTQFSLADIDWMPYVEYLFAAGSGDLFTSREHLGAWWKKVSERPSWKKATGK